jgi:hypothetical protein
MKTGGRASHPSEGVTVVTWGDDCPGGYCTDGIAVHQALIPFVDDGGDVVMPQWYAVCCKCYTEQFIKKYGIENVAPCGCEVVDLQSLARTQRATAEERQRLEAAVAAEKLREWREQFLKDREMQERPQEIVIVRA